MSRKKGKQKKRKHYSDLDQHKRKGSTLLSPLAALPNLAHSSWVNDRLPELVWCALLITHLGQERALAMLRKGIISSRPLLVDTSGRLDLGLTGLTRLPAAARDALLEPVLNDSAARTVLRSLLLLPSLPGGFFWSERLDPPTEDDWNLLAVAVGHVFNHQSQDATDCRWIRVVFMTVNGRIVLPAGSDELGKELLEYPNYGDQKAVRPTIRALEMSFSPGPDAPHDPWPADFWDDCWNATPCKRSSLVPLSAIAGTGTTIERIDLVSSLLQSHFMKTIPGTSLDAKHDAVFGLAAYGLALIGELLRIGNATANIGRAVLRMILEVYVTLSYLLVKDSPTLWTEFRSYGAGQAKLAFLKLDNDEGVAAGYISVELLEQIANEDRSLDLQPIVLGHWGETNLRHMAEAAGIKDTYDRLYPWPSAFVHGNWAALRASVFDLCVNPLHRAHRLLRQNPTPQSDAVRDAADLVDKTLALVDQAYPGLAERITL